MVVLQEVLEETKISDGLQLEHNLGGGRRTRKKRGGWQTPEKLESISRYSPIRRVERKKRRKKNKKNKKNKRKRNRRKQTKRRGKKRN